MTRFSKPTSTDRSPTRRFSARSRAWMFTALSALTGLGLVGDLAAPRPAGAQTGSPGWSTTTTIAGTQPTAPGAARGTVHYHIADAATNQVMAVPNRSTFNSVHVVTQPATGFLAEGWGLVQTGAGSGVYQLRNLGSGLCLEIPDAKAPSGTAAQQYQCDPTATKPNQLWGRISKGGNLYVLRNKATGLFLFRTADGRVIQSHAGGTAWTFENPTDVKLLCTGTNYSGGCFGTIRSKYGPVPNDNVDRGWRMPFSHLDGTPIAGRTIWSIYNSRGDAGDVFGAALFSGASFTGTCRYFRFSNPDLSQSVGSVAELPKPASAVMDIYTCPPDNEVWLCQDSHFRGGCKEVRTNEANLRNSGYDDQTSSIYMKSGMTAALYSQPDFEGTCHTITAGDLTLRDNTIGEDRVSSVWLGHRCEQDVQLCEHSDLEGRCVSFRSDKPSLAATDIGNDTASSVRVPAGWQISVWSDENHMGLVDAFNGPITQNFGAGAGATSFGMLTVTNAPNDSASSLDIRIVPSGSDPCADRHGCLMNTDDPDAWA